MLRGAQPATWFRMAQPRLSERTFVDALDEPALIVEAGIVRFANHAAQGLFGANVEGKDLRLAIRHPQALEQVLARRSADVDATGIVEPGRSWRLLIRRLGGTATLVRMVHRAEGGSGERVGGD